MTKPIQRSLHAGQCTHQWEPFPESKSRLKGIPFQGGGMLRKADITNFVKV